MKRTLWVLVAALGLAAGASAAQNDAGCGLGAQLFKENRPVDQILAATTNGTFGTQTFGITTGTLGCTSGGLIKTAQERRVFTAANFAALQQELAAGSGQYEASLAALTGCRAEPFAAFAKARYEKLIPSAKTTSDELLNNIDKELLADPSMAKACGV
ncbi:MAG TPA: DUF3015 family protein [Elusimicrobiota bacterium]|jgi:hypothetical protein|nr:DUF3015 family protein [Elusimicrobiota bacterium]